VREHDIQVLWGTVTRLVINIDLCKLNGEDVREQQIALLQASLQLKALYSAGVQ
jgi:hypothetical protein